MKDYNGLPLGILVLRDGQPWWDFGTTGAYERIRSFSAFIADRTGLEGYLNVDSLWGCKTWIIAVCDLKRKSQPFI